MSDNLLMLLEMIEEVLEEQKRANKGNVLEGILVAAFGALFDKTFSNIKAQPQSKQKVIFTDPSAKRTITSDDIVAMIAKLQGGGKQLSFTKNYVVQKTLELQIGLKEDEIAELKAIAEDQNIRADYTAQIDSCVAYVNQRRFRKYAKRVLKDVEKLTILTIGKSQGKTTADIRFKEDGKTVGNLDISIKQDNTVQLTQSPVTVSGTGKEIENFINTIDAKYGPLFNVDETAYNKFKKDIEIMLTPLAADNCIVAESREELYEQVDLVIQNCKQIQTVGDAKNIITIFADNLRELLQEVANKLNKNPDEFAKIIGPFLQSNIGAPEIFKSAKKGKQPKVGRGGEEGINITKNLASIAQNNTFQFRVNRAGPRVSFYIVMRQKPPADATEEEKDNFKPQETEEEMIQFRFRRDASSQKGSKKFMIRLYLQTTEFIYNLLKFGTRMDEQLTIEIVDDT